MSDLLKEFEVTFQQIETNFNSKKIPKVKITLKGVINNLNNLIDILLRKSLLKNENYNYDTFDKDNIVPEEKAFNDNEKPRMLYERLQNLIKALDYLHDNLPDDIIDITEEFLEKLRKTLLYFSFNNLNSSSAGINTRTLKETIDKIMNSSDEILKKIVGDNLKILSDNYNFLTNFIEEISKFKKERYKSDIRFKVFPYLPIDLNEKVFNEKQEEYLKRLQTFIEVNIPEVIYNKVWVVEAIKECYTINDNNALEKAQKQFLTEAERKKNESTLNSPREKLIKIIINLANLKNILEDIYINFDYNFKLIKNRKKSFNEQIIDLLKKLFNIQMDDDFFQIEYINPQNKTIQKDIININEFLVSFKKKINLFSEILKPNSTIYDKIKRGTEDALFKFLDDTYFSTLLLKERIGGIETEISISAPKNIRPKIRDNSTLIENLDKQLSNISEQRKKIVMQHETFNISQKKHL